MTVARAPVFVQAGPSTASLAQKPGVGGTPASDSNARLSASDLPAPNPSVVSDDSGTGPAPRPDSAANVSSAIAP